MIGYISLYCAIAVLGMDAVRKRTFNRVVCPYIYDYRTNVPQKTKKCAHKLETHFLNRTKFGTPEN